MISTIETPHGPVNIRPTRVEDAPAYRELRLEALQRHPEVYGTDYAEAAALPIEHWVERMQAGAGGPYTMTYVAEAAGALLGMAVLLREQGVKVCHSATIISVYVRPTWRGAGLADALIEACIAYARTLELRLVKLSVVTTNVAAIRRYLRLGFSIYGVEPDAISYNGRYYDELLMVRRLLPDS